jgi:hypothetical protein
MNEVAYGYKIATVRFRAAVRLIYPTAFLGFSPRLSTLRFLNEHCAYILYFSRKLRVLLEHPFDLFI